MCKRGICGVGAICLAENHAHVCQCPPYFIPSPSPQIKCTKQREGEVCPQGQCQVRINDAVLGAMHKGRPHEGGRGVQELVNFADKQY